MAVPSRKRCISRTKRRRSAVNLKFKKKKMTRSLSKCDNCKKNKPLHFVCLNCLKK